MDKVRGRNIIRVPAKASIWYIASSAVARSVSVVGTPIFTRLLTAREYGIFPQYTTYLSLFTVVATLELSGGVILRGLQKFEDRRAEFISCAIGLIATVWAVTSAVILSFSAIFGDFTGLGNRVLWLMLFHVLLNAIISVYTAEARYSYKYRAVAATNIVIAILTPLVAVLLISAFSVGGVGRIYASLFSATVVTLPFLFIIFERSKRLYDGEIWRYLLRFSIPFLPHYFSAAIIIRIGEVMLSRVHGSEALAKYSVAMSVGLSLSVITNGVLSALSPWMLRRVRAGDIRQSRSLLFVATRGLSIVTLLVLSIVPETIRIVAPPEYHDCLFAVYPLALSVLPTFLSNAIVAGEMYFERSAVASLPTVVAAIVTVVLTTLFSPFIDYRAVAVFLPIAYVITCSLNCLVFKKMSGEMPILIGKSAIIYLLTVGYALLIFAFRELFWVRAILALPLVFPLFSTAKETLSTIREKK